MSELQVTARFRIHEGKLEEFKRLALQCMQIVREQDSGTHRYDWYFNADQTECVVREIYRDSEALLEHIGHVGEAIPAIVAIADPDIEVFGSPSAELLEASAALAPRVYSHYQSI